MCLLPMKKRDFIQTAAIQFMPELQWDVDRSIRAAEKLWKKLDERGYGEPRETGPREMPRAYDKLTVEQRAAFDLFWIAFDYKQGKDRAAAAWLKLGDIGKEELSELIHAAKCTAVYRRNNPTVTPKMAEGWLTERRWLDHAVSETEQQQKTDDDSRKKLQSVNAELAHAKRMAEMTGDDFWPNEVKRLTNKLKQLRNEATP